MSLLSVENVTKEYSARLRANDGISLKIDEGEVYGLLGPNGAGKTTLVNQIVGLLAPTSGRILFDQQEVTSSPEIARKLCSFQPQTHVPIDGLTPMQAIYLVGRMRGGESMSVKRRANELIDHLEIREWVHEPGERLSGGVRRLVAFCMAVVVPGKLIILDEPTNDVDPLRRRLLWNQVRGMAERGAAVLLVTHNVLEAERSVDRLAILDKGRIVTQGTPGSMKNETAGFFRLEITREPGSELFEMPQFFRYPVNGGRRVIGNVKECDLTIAVDWVSGLRKADQVEEFSIGPATLEDAYLRKIGRAEALPGNGKEGLQDVS